MKNKQTDALRRVRSPRRQLFIRRTKFESIHCREVHIGAHSEVHSDRSSGNSLFWIEDQLCGKKKNIRDRSPTLQLPTSV
jgi:hypothetical protein